MTFKAIVVTIPSKSEYSGDTYLFTRYVPEENYERALEEFQRGASLLGLRVITLQPA